MPKGKTIHQHLPFAPFLVVLFLFAACSSTPSESEGRKFLEDKGAEKKLYTVKSFTKTNGINDERTYTMEYEAEVECLQPGALVISASSYMIPCEKKGQSVKLKSKLFFEKTDNGWRVKP